MSILKFNLKKLILEHLKDGNTVILKPYYSGFCIFIDESVVKYLTDCQNLIVNNEMFLVIEYENKKHWRISHVHETERNLWGCVVGGKIKIKKVEKITKILCTEADLNFSISGGSGIDT